MSSAGTPETRCLHRAYGLVVSAPRRIRELPLLTTAAPADIVVEWSTAPAPAPTDWFRHWRTGDPGTELRAGRLADQDYALEFAAGATFVAGRDGRTVTCFVADDVPETVVGRLLCDQVLPLVLSRRGLGVFHGSAVAVDGSAVVFLGPSGRGKSTLAAALARIGHPILTDDCVVVARGDADGLTVPASYPGVRLWPDSLAAFWDGSAATAPDELENGKARYATTGALPHADAAVPLGRVFLLDDGPAGVVSARRVGGAAAIAEIVSCQFLLDHTDHDELAASFAAANRLVANGPVARLALPRDLDAVEAHATSVVELVSE